MSSHSCFFVRTFVRNSTGPPGVPRPEYCCNAMFLIFMAAFTSRSCVAPQTMQRQERWSSRRADLTKPQPEQVFEEGTKRPIFKNVFPCHWHLYSRKSKRVDQPTSAIERAILPFFIIPETFKSSVAIAWLSLTKREDILCKKSWRWLAIFSCSSLSRWFAFSRFALPFCLREALRCNTFSRASELFKRRGLAIFSPAEVVAESINPTSIPNVFSGVTGNFLGAITPVSNKTEAKYFPVGVRLIVMLFTFPLVLLLNLALTPSLKLVNIILPLSKSTVLYCGQTILCLENLLLNLGKLALPLKKLAYETSTNNISQFND